MPNKFYDKKNTYKQFLFPFFLKFTSPPSSLSFLLRLRLPFPFPSVFPFPFLLLICSVVVWCLGLGCCVLCLFWCVSVVWVWVGVWCVGVGGCVCVGVCGCVGVVWCGCVGVSVWV